MPSDAGLGKTPVLDAEALIQHGIELRKAGDDRGALSAFERAFSLTGSARALAQMALAWVLRHSEVTSALIGASRSEQIDDAVAALRNLSFSNEELQTIESILSS